MARRTPNFRKALDPLTPTEMQESTTPAAESAATELTHSHEGHDHDHAGHDHAGHTHQHGPTLNPELSRSITVEAPAEDVQKAFDRVVKRYAKLARIPGFRAGKVPPALIKSRFAKDVRQEVLEGLVSERFRTALEADKLQPISQPQISELTLAEGMPLKFTATFEVLPTFSVDGYDTVTAARPDVTVTEDEFQVELNAVLDHHATVEPVEEARAIVDSDWTEITFTGKLQPLAETVTEQGLEAVADEQPITGDDVLIEIGGKNTLPAFSDALRGKKVGDEITIEAAYPADFGEPRLAGRTVDYDVQVKAIKTKTYPERTDEFAKTLGNYDSWADFEGKLRERLQNRKKDVLETQERDKMLEQLVERFQFPVPETFVQQQVDARLERGLRALAQQGMTSDAMRQLDFARLRAAQRESAETEVKISLILDKIAEQEGVIVADDEIERELLMLSIQQREPLETLRKRLAEDGTIGRIREQMRREKTTGQLYEKLAK